jgi:hypothetical protein
MDNLLPRVGVSKNKVRIPDYLLIIRQALSLSWLRVKRASMGNLFPMVGGSKKKASLPDCELIIKLAL